MSSQADHTLGIDWASTLLQQSKWSAAGNIERPSGNLDCVSTSSPPCCLTPQGAPLIGDLDGGVSSGVLSDGLADDANPTSSSSRCSAAMHQHYTTDASSTTPPEGHTSRSPQTGNNSFASPPPQLSAAHPSSVPAAQDTPAAAAAHQAPSLHRSPTPPSVAPASTAPLGVQQLSHPRARNKGILCEAFFTQSTCSHNHECPFLHISPATDVRQLPDAVCSFHKNGACLREGCRFFHGTEDRLLQLRTSGTRVYRLSEEMEHRWPPQELAGVQPLPHPQPKPNAAAVAKPSSAAVVPLVAPPAWPTGPMGMMPVAGSFMPQQMMMVPMMMCVPTGGTVGAAGQQQQPTMMLMPSYSPAAMMMMPQQPFMMAPQAFQPAGTVMMPQQQFAMWPSAAAAPSHVPLPTPSDSPAASSSNHQ